MQIVPYPHPALTFKSVDVRQIDSQLHRTIERMFELMYEAQGIGLAANQVGLPFRFFLVNLAGRPGNPDEELVFINPVISRKKGSAVAEEGCLSLPGLYGDVRRPDQLRVEAFDLEGQGFEMDLSDLPARVVQHENDHLDGVLFTDRMREAGNSAAVDIQIPKFVDSYRQAQRAGQVKPDEELRRELQAMAEAGVIPEDYLSRPPVEIAVPQLGD